jgi:hypothetical protein
LAKTRRVLRQRAVHGHAERHGINKIRLPPHDFGKGRLVTALGISAQ